MLRFSRAPIAFGATLALLVATLSVSPTSTAQSTPASRAGVHHDGSRQSSQVVLDWERILFRTVYTTGATPVPVGVPVLGFTSLAMYDAVQAAHRRGHHSSRHGTRPSKAAAVATAAHHVLVHYYPGDAAALDADLATTLATVPDGRAERKGIRIGARSAARMLDSRVGDGFLDPTIHYTLPAGVGVWQPAPPNTDMLAAWLGSMRTVVLKRPVRGGLPDPLTSAAYAADFNEVKSLGGTTPTARTQEQTDTALFFNSNSATTLGDALVRRLEEHPTRLVDTARLFAAMHASMTDALIRCWQLKRDVGFWRPIEAIAQADSDGNAATSAEPGWTPLVPTPNYSEYVSGHACLTAPAAETIRRTLGEDTPLELRSVNSPTPRLYAHLTDIETDAFNARIWSGLHFRKAMTDGYRIGHRTAARVLRALDDDHGHHGHPGD